MEVLKMVFEKIRDIVVEQLDVDADKVTLSASITEDLGADSLDVVDLVMSWKRNSIWKSLMKLLKTSRQSVTLLSILKTISNIFTKRRTLKDENL